ncbi:MAG TPA: CoA transferase subunit A [Dehalococcoidia bacterium]|jgi:3-oxoacid CoA-transferase subunit A
MIDKVFPSPHAALADMPDGVTIMFGGFVSAGSPTTLILALQRRGVRDITGIANNIGLGDRLDVLCENRQLKKMIASFAIRASGARQSLFEQQYRAGEVELEVVPQGTLAERIRAGGAGIGGFYTRTGVGTPVDAGKELRTIDGEQYLFERPLTADYALLKAAKADPLGNLVYHGAGRNFNVPMATAARTVIVEVDEIVPAGSLDPEAIVTPGIYVDRVVLGERHVIRWFG